MQQIELWMLIPFGIMLLSIAVIPLIAPRWWGKNHNKLIYTLLIAVPTAIMLVRHGLEQPLLEQILDDYVPFIVLLATLFVVTGGIKVHYTTTPTPLANSIMLIIGYCIASLVGTTGAAMLLIRPLLEINRQRTHKAHTVMFFIAMVANCGGVLSPLGDPPLFLLYLRGASFGWFQSMDQAGGCHLPDGISADHAVVPGIADFPHKHAVGVGDYAGGQRSAPDRPAVRLG